MDKRTEMPDDGVTGHDDGDGGAEDAAASLEEPADGEATSESGDDGSAVPSSDQAPASEETRGHEASVESSQDEEKSASPPQVHTLPKVSPEASAERMLALYAAKHEQSNRESRPPDDEHVTFRSVTLAEVYIGPEIDGLSAALRRTEWFNVGEQFADEIARSRQADSPYDSEFLLLSSPNSHWTMQGYGKADLPRGIHRIVGQLFVLGPSMVALVLTFALSEPEAGRLEKALRKEATAELEHSGTPQVWVRTVNRIKDERAQAVLDEVGGCCLSWLKTWAPGALTKGDGLSVPLCSLISLTWVTPFQVQGGPLVLLDLQNSYNAVRFADPGYLFLKPRQPRKRYREFIAAFNEKEAFNEKDGVASYLDLSAAPEMAGRALFSFMIVNGLESALSLFESRMRATRSDLASFNFDTTAESLPIWGKMQRSLHSKPPAESPAAGLRNRLLKLSRDIAVVSGDIKGVLNPDTFVSLWADYPLLQPVVPSHPAPPAQDPAEAPRKNIADFMANLKVQDAELRELVLVASQAVSEAQDRHTQKTLNVLTRWLVIFTVLLVVIGGFTIWKTFYDTSDSPAPKPTTRASAPAAKSSVRPTAIPVTSKKAAQR